ncbi:hypothetical protein YC2023_107487 [Brassica napus]
MGQGKIHGGSLNHKELKTPSKQQLKTTRRSKARLMERPLRPDYTKPSNRSQVTNYHMHMKERSRLGIFSAGFGNILEEQWQVDVKLN